MTQKKKESRLDNQSVNLLDRAMSQLGKSMMNKSESGTSVGSSGPNGAGFSNQIDQKKIERLLILFNLMQKNDNIMHIIMLAMRELKTLIPT
jgi:hypothetical protein|tara:strand:+ start:206 stop:481 length:276 start_codon:yes stop_codon:yes gene_type:complete